MESEPGAGSTFSFAIPLEPGAPRRAAPDASSRPASDGAGSRRSSSRTTGRSADLLQLYLEGAGYAVSFARDGVEGLELARRLRPGRRDPRHPAAAAQRLGSARAAQERPGDRRTSRS